MDVKRYLITSALPYINGTKHLGNMAGSLLPADIYARFLRQQGHDVMFICGTDEHGTPAEIAAQNANMDVKSYCNHMYEVQRRIYANFGLSFNFFGRSSCDQNVEITQEFFFKLQDAGYIFEDVISQYYSAVEGRFLPDRFINGQCPRCGFLSATGDQCDGCGALLNPEELINPKSSISGDEKLELRRTSHLFLDLEKTVPLLQKWHDSNRWGNLTRGIISKWMDNEGLKARCITRDNKWGIPVPLLHLTPKVFYVWFDAPYAYIAITKAYGDTLGDAETILKKWWYSDSVEYTQFMAKDNVPFHAIFWPAQLLASRDNVKLVDDIKGFNWLTYDGGKFSTSRLRGVFLDQALELFPADYWRYYLAARAPESSDSDFSFQDFAQVVNSELVGGLGNFVRRVFKLASNNYEETNVSFNTREVMLDEALVVEITELFSNLQSLMYKKEVRKSIEKIRLLWSIANRYIAEAQPWTTIKSDPHQALQVIKNCFYFIYLFSLSVAPVIPFTAEKLRRSLGLDSCEIESLAGVWEVSIFISPVYSDDSLLFDRIDKSLVDQLTGIYQGVPTPDEPET
ncbi:Methionyl-tRNA ligase [Pseudomonas savastanoi pv. glycinea]|uniref:methionine--tRNA ligase n=1 Tax=Pseudomonas savastanoi TaxID=29438 RepID=UPI000EFE942C|nr:methionine--tRNA ligase [Pseudomonas savastanoi]RML35114.1 Methionyl-tRNA ligase [Pseudomonas savastanoi pv. glycinea]RML85480.1 Methionyl-tRNA ligase [Pseudomonas savastanoi pv. glycinea]